jgi:hypothetical protein
MAIGLEFRVARDGFGFGMGFHANLKHEGAQGFPFVVERSMVLKTQCGEICNLSLIISDQRFEMLEMTNDGFSVPGFHG